MGTGSSVVTPTRAVMTGSCPLWYCATWIVGYSEPAPYPWASLKGPAVPIFFQVPPLMAVPPDGGVYL